MDLYALLGVGRAASGLEIERAFRRLARRLHPGVNPGDRAAEEMYRQVEHAFGVLSDQERRLAYDRGGSRQAEPSPAEALAPAAPLAFEGFDFSFLAEGPTAATFTELFADVFQHAAREATTPSRGADIEAIVELSFRDAVLGSRSPVSIVRQERCPSCAGDGRIPRPSVVCPGCDGDGTRRWTRGHMVFTRDCDDCGGTGRLSAQPCRPCSGAGIQARSEVATIETPPGVEDGDRMAVPGRGNAGALGGPAGDLYVTIRVAPHSHFRRAGRDLHLTLPLAVHEAALGGRVDVPTLDEPVRLKIPAGTASGRQFRIPGAGVRGTDHQAPGDLIVDVQIVLPPVRDERSRALLREFGQLNPADVREHLFGAGRSSRPRSD